MQRFLAVGDIHGCAKTFKHLLTEVFKLQKSDAVICVGDYVDRGPDSKSVIDFILELRSSGYTIHALRGNHEQIMMDSVHNLDMSRLWMGNGGDITLDSFGVDSYDGFNQEYKTFFESTLHYLTHKNCIFAHAGLNLKIDDPFEDKHAMLWIRDFHESAFLDGRILIHGHTPIPLGKILAQGSSNIINIDGGCVYRQHEGFGNLIGYNITDQRFVHVRNQED